jgi:hypothetical protein
MRRGFIWKAGIQEKTGGWVEGKTPIGLGVLLGDTGHLPGLPSSGRCRVLPPLPAPPLGKSP